MKGTKRRGTKRKGSKRRGVTRKGSKRGGGSACSRTAPVQIFRNFGRTLTDAHFEGERAIGGSQHNAAVQEIRDLLECDITKRRTPENSGTDFGRVIDGTVLHTLVDNIFQLLKSFVSPEPQYKNI